MALSFPVKTHPSSLDPSVFGSCIEQVRKNGTMDVSKLLTWAALPSAHQPPDLSFKYVTTYMDKVHPTYPILNTTVPLDSHYNHRKGTIQYSILSLVVSLGMLYESDAGDTIMGATALFLDTEKNIQDGTTIEHARVGILLALCYLHFSRVEEASQWVKQSCEICMKLQRDVSGTSSESLQTVTLVSIQLETDVMGERMDPPVSHLSKMSLPRTFFSYPEGLQWYTKTRMALYRDISWVLDGKGWRTIGVNIEWLQRLRDPRIGNLALLLIGKCYSMCYKFTFWDEKRSVEAHKTYDRTVGNKFLVHYGALSIRAFNRGGIDKRIGSVDWNDQFCMALMIFILEEANVNKNHDRLKCLMSLLKRFDLVQYTSSVRRTQYLVLRDTAQKFIQDVDRRMDEIPLDLLENTDLDDLEDLLFT